MTTGTSSIAASTCFYELQKTDLRLMLGGAADLVVFLRDRDPKF